MIYLTAIIKSKPSYLNEVKTFLEDLVIQTKTETACVQYDLHQGIDDENLFLFYEIWENQQGLDYHNNQPYIKALGGIIDEKFAEAPVIYLTRKL